MQKCWKHARLKTWAQKFKEIGSRRNALKKTTESKNRRDQIKKHRCFENIFVTIPSLLCVCVCVCVCVRVCVCAVNVLCFDLPRTAPSTNAAGSLHLPPPKLHPLPLVLQLILPTWAGAHAGSVTDLPLTEAMSASRESRGYQQRRTRMVMATNTCLRLTVGPLFRAPGSMWKLAYR